MVTLYERLGVAPDADRDTIRAAYRRLAREHHPDRGGDEATMAAINGAWLVLRDPMRRAAYDSQHRRVERRLAAAGPSSAVTLDFGRYAGWDLDAVARQDPDYLLWLERMPIGRPLRPEIRRVLDARKAVVTTALRSPGPRAAPRRTGWRSLWR
jgi:molecular chaperone DnaJ